MYVLLGFSPYYIFLSRWIGANCLHSINRFSSSAKQSAFTHTRIRIEERIARLISCRAHLLPTAVPTMVPVIIPILLLLLLLVLVCPEYRGRKWRSIFGHMADRTISETRPARRSGVM